MDEYFIVVPKPQTDAYFLMEEPNPANPRTRILSYVVYDAEGGRHEGQLSMPPTDSATIRVRRNITFPNDKAPYIVTSECPCIEYLFLPESSGASYGNRSYVRKVELDAAVSTTQPKVNWHHDTNLIHWTVFFGGDFFGDFHFDSPKGTRVMTFYSRLDRGGLYNGTTLLEAGDWTLRLNGTGEFELKFNLAFLDPAAWPLYGLKPPPNARQV